MSCLKFKHPSDGFCPYIEVPEGKYFIQSKSANETDVYVLRFKRSGGWLLDTGETDVQKAVRAANRAITGDGKTVLWWDYYVGGRTIKTDDDKRYYLYQSGRDWPRHWFLRCCYDEETVLSQGVESYAEFARSCEEYVNERHGQMSLF